MLKRMMMALVLGVVISTVACPGNQGWFSSTAALAGGTWNELKFGMTLAEVRTSLSRQGLNLQLSDGRWQVKPGWDVKLPRTVPLHFDPILFFATPTD